MEAVFNVLFWVAVVLIAVVRKRMTAGVEMESLCLTCVNAVVTRGKRGKVMVACNFAGAMRPVKFTVCECTGYFVPGSTSKLVKIEGFAPDQRKVYAEVAIS